MKYLFIYYEIFERYLSGVRILREKYKKRNPRVMKGELVYYGGHFNRYRSKNVSRKTRKSRLIKKKNYPSKIL